MDCLEIVSPQGAGGRFLKAKFYRQGDRYAHQFRLCDGRRESILLSSCEGAEPANWPPSPPLQQLTVEDRRGGDRVLLLVGQAGRSHWSMSVEPAEFAAALTFDVACRVQQQPERLGSTYQWESTLNVAVAAHAVEIGWTGTLCRLLGQAGDTSDPVIESAGGQRFQIGPTSARGPLPRTVRWKYRVEITG